MRITLFGADRTTTLDQLAEIADHHGVPPSAVLREVLARQ
jgi:hypothetical protein